MGWLVTVKGTNETQKHRKKHEWAMMPTLQPPCVFIRAEKENRMSVKLKSYELKSHLSWCDWGSQLRKALLGSQVLIFKPQQNHAEYFTMQVVKTCVGFFIC